LQIFVEVFFVNSQQNLKPLLSGVFAGKLNGKKKHSSCLKFNYETFNKVPDTSLVFKFTVSKRQQKENA
jgi:hypothetical protein